MANLELKSDNVEEMRQEIVTFGVKVLEVPGGQVLRLAGINEDLSRYEGTEDANSSPEWRLSYAAI